MSSFADYMIAVILSIHGIVNRNLIFKAKCLERLMLEHEKAPDGASGAFCRRKVDMTFEEWYENRFGVKLCDDIAQGLSIEEAREAFNAGQQDGETIREMQTEIFRLTEENNRLKMQISKERV